MASFRIARKCSGGKFNWRAIAVALSSRSRVPKRLADPPAQAVGAGLGDQGIE